MTVVITEVTEMTPNTYCAAAWSPQSNRMVRPLPNGSNWPATLVNSMNICPGTVISAKKSGVATNGSYPHLMEDVAIDPSSIALVAVNAVNWQSNSAPPVVFTLPAAFQNRIQNSGQWNGLTKGIHVPVGSQSRSLWGLGIDRTQLAFFEDGGSLRAALTDPSGSYSLAVSSRELKDVYRGAGGINALNAYLPHAGRLHVRVGLAREWHQQPGKCFVMVNGVQW